MISLSQPLPDCRPTSPVSRDWPRWMDDAERRVRAATVQDFREAGCGVDTEPEDAAVVLCQLWGYDEAARDVRERLEELAARRFRDLEAATYAALDAA